MTLPQLWHCHRGGATSVRRRNQGPFSCDCMKSVLVPGRALLRCCVPRFVAGSGSGQPCMAAWLYDCPALIPE